MANRTTVEQLIGSVIAKMRAKRSGTITNITQNGKEYTIETANTFDLMVGNYVTINGNSVIITAVVENVSFTVKSSTSLIGATDWVANYPLFVYGDPIDMNAELNAGNNDQDTKYPSVIMFEIKRTRGFRDLNSAYDQVPRIRLFFMDQANYEDSDIDQLYDVVDRMECLAYEFMDCLDVTPHVFAQDIEFDLNKHSKWGVRVIRDRKANAETIFDNNLSGVELIIDLPIAKTLQFRCVC